MNIKKAKLAAATLLCLSLSVTAAKASDQSISPKWFEVKQTIYSHNKDLTGEMERIIERNLKKIQQLQENLIQEDLAEEENNLMGNITMDSAIRAEQRAIRAKKMAMLKQQEYELVTILLLDKSQRIEEIRELQDSCRGMRSSSLPLCADIDR